MWRDVWYDGRKLLSNDDANDINNICSENNYYSARNDKEYDNVCAKYNTGRVFDYAENINNNN